MKTRYFIVDDHAFTAEGIKQALNSTSAEFVGMAHNVDLAHKLILQKKPDCIFIDHSILEKTGLDLVSSLKGIIPTSQFILVSQVENKAVLRTYKELGLRGLVSKLSGANDIQAAFVTSDQTYICSNISKILNSADETEILTPRELEVSKYISRGKTNKEIAQHLDCSEFTIKSHKVNIMRKLNCSTSVEIGVWFLKNMN